MSPYCKHWQQEDILDEPSVSMQNVGEPCSALDICLVDHCAAMQVSTDRLDPGAARALREHPQVRSIDCVAPQIKLRSVNLRCSVFKPSHDGDLPMSDMTLCGCLGQAQGRASYSADQ